MAEWAPKRFWKETSVIEAEGGFTVQLDGRQVRTPAKAALIVPTRAMADAIAAEWQAQTNKIDPETMPCTRSANSAIDKLTHQQADVVEMLAAYGETDLLSYRADVPPDLVARQQAAWDPLLDWSRDALGAPLAVTAGVMAIPQDPASIAAMKAEIAALDLFKLAAFHDLVALSGSLVLALAVLKKRLTAEEAWHLSRIDETYQIEQWGHDEDAAEQAEIKHQAFLQAERFLGLCL